MLITDSKIGGLIRIKERKKNQVEREECESISINTAIGVLLVYLFHPFYIPLMQENFQ